MQQSFNEKIEELLEKGRMRDREIEVGLMCDVDVLTTCIEVELTLFTNACLMLNSRRGVIAIP